MVTRVAKRGRREGRAFQGCIRYPACVGTRPSWVSFLGHIGYVLTLLYAATLLLSLILHAISGILR